MYKKTLEPLIYKEKFKKSSVNTLHYQIKMRRVIMEKLIKLLKGVRDDVDFRECTTLVDEGVFIIFS